MTLKMAWAKTRYHKPKGPRQDVLLYCRCSKVVNSKGTAQRKPESRSEPSLVLGF